MGLFRKLRKSPKLFLSSTGMRLDRFEQLLPAFEAAYEQLEAQRKQRVVKTGLKRQRKPGAGASFATDMTERLLMVLLYYRLYLTQEFMTLLFNVEDKSSICRAISQMHPVFEAVLPVPERARKTVFDLAEKETRRRRINNIEDFKESYPELSILIDGVEQPKQRPKDKQKRKSDYSGKKKRHTLKQIVTTTPKGIILDQSPAVGGRTHDFKAFKAHLEPDEGWLGGAAHPGTAAHEQLRALRIVATTDSGFTGIDKLSLPMETRVTERARRGHPLTSEQKILNQVRSRERVRVEHTIGQRKKYRIASQLYRNSDAIYDGVMNVISGLVNLRAYDRIAAQTGIDLMEVRN